MGFLTSIIPLHFTITIYLIHFIYLILSFREQRSGNTLYQELSFQDTEAMGEIEDGVDITGTNSVKVFLLYCLIALGHSLLSHNLAYIFWAQWFGEVHFLQGEK